jgi:hypothetical protein
LENARLFEETQQNIDRLDALYRQQRPPAWARTPGFPQPASEN